jgi:hypothetical protein
MTVNDHINELFDHSGCLRQSAIVRYIDGKLDEKELQAVLNHLDTCPLCRDAAEGISGIGTVRFIEEMQQIRTDIFAKSLGNDRKHRLRLILAVSAAASVAIILGVLFFYQQTRLSMKSNIAQSVDAGKEIKEKAKTFEESAPLNESIRPARSEKKEGRIAGGKSTEESRIVKSVPKETQPVGEIIEDKMEVADVIQDSFFTEAEYSDFQEMSDDKPEEISAGYAEPQSVKVDIPSGAAMPVGKRSKSAINTGLMQEKAKSEAVMTLPAGYDIAVTETRLTFKGGGLNEFIDYIQDQINTKDRLLRKIHTDSIFISFIIDTIGRPADINIPRQTDEETARKILEIFKNSPDWLPGKDSGIMVNRKYIICVSIPDD